MISKSFFTLFIVFIDQMTKKLALQYSFEKGVYKLNSFMKIYIRWNPGLSFSLCSSFYTWTLKFIVLSACIAIINLWYKTKNKFDSIAYSLILGGGISNVIDRFMHNAVLDFISVSFGDMFFPVFNIADIVITIGVCVLLWRNIMPRKSR